MRFENLCKECTDNVGSAAVEKKGSKAGKKNLRLSHLSVNWISHLVERVDLQVVGGRETYRTRYEYRYVTHETVDFESGHSVCREFFEPLRNAIYSTE
jgi:hypothetical protein